MLVYILGLQGTDPTWYTAITGQLTPEQTKQLEDVFKLADQRKAAAGILSRLASVLQTIFINVSYHILVASLTLMALF